MNEPESPIAHHPEASAPRQRRIAMIGAIVVVAGVALTLAYHSMSAATPTAPTRPPDALDFAGIPCDPETKREVPARSPAYGCRLTKDLARPPLVCRKDSALEIYENGKLRRCWVAAETVVDGVRCKDDVTLSPAGKLQRCQLAVETKAGEVTVPAGAWLTLYPSGSPRRVESFDVPIRAPVGAQALSCTGALTFFHEGGTLARCTLAEAAKVGGESVSAGTVVCLDEVGNRVKDCDGMSFEMTE